MITCKTTVPRDAFFNKKNSPYFFNTHLQKDSAERSFFFKKNIFPPISFFYAHLQKDSVKKMFSPLYLFFMLACIKTVPRDAAQSLCKSVNKKNRGKK
jgi:hypothetical protein